MRSCHVSGTWHLFFEAPNCTEISILCSHLNSVLDPAPTSSTTVTSKASNQMSAVTLRPRSTFKKKKVHVPAVHTGTGPVPVRRGVEHREGQDMMLNASQPIKPALPRLITRLHTYFSLNVSIRVSLCICSLKKCLCP